MDIEIILQEIEEIEDSLKWSSPEAKPWHIKRLADAKSELFKLQSEKKIMNLGKFRELTKEMPDDVDLIIDAKANPFGNCWSVLTIEATELASFGKLCPALKMSEQNPEWAEDSDSQLFINPENCC